MRNKKKVWGRKDVYDLTGDVILITGGNSGIGFESAKVFAEHGACVIIACRNLSKGRVAREKIVQKYPCSYVDVMKLDLSSLKSIKSFSNKFKHKYSRLDILLNNAGIMRPPFSKTKDGFEIQMGVNHLGHFALTGYLLDLILKSGLSRIVTVSSRAHRFGLMDFDDIMWKNKKYDSRLAYGQSKLANLLFSYELDRRLKRIGSPVISLAAHPGRARTNLANKMFKNPIKKFLARLITPLMTQSPQDGAMPIIRACVDKNVLGGEFYGPDDIEEKRGPPVKIKSSKGSYSLSDAKRLWEISENFTGVKY